MWVWHVPELRSASEHCIYTPAGRLSAALTPPVVFAVWMPNAHPNKRFAVS